MKILLVTHYYEPELGAPQRRWSALVSRWQAAGHAVTVLCPPPHYPDAATTAYLRTPKNRVFRSETGNYGERIVRMPYIKHGYAGLSRLIDQILTAGCSVLAGVSLGKSAQRKNVPYDAVISTVPGLPSMLAGRLIARTLDLPHIAEMRDAWPDVVTGDILTQSSRQSLHSRVLKKFIHSTVTRWQKDATFVVTTTRRFKEVLIERGIKASTVIRNGADPSEWDIPAISEPAPGQLRVQYLGTVGRSQGLEILLDAVEEVTNRRADINIQTRIVGSGAEVPRLKKIAQQRGIPVEFFVPVSRQELSAAYSWANVAIVSLKHTKPFAWTVPSKIFELLATRRHIMALVEGEAARIVQDSGAGTVLPPGDSHALAQALIEAADQPEKLRVGESGIEMLNKKYSYDHMAQHYLLSIRRAIALYCGNK